MQVSRKERVFWQWEGPVQRPRHGKGAGTQEEASVVGASRTVRTVLSWGWGEPGGASSFGEAAFILKPEYSRSQELPWGAGLRGKAEPGSPRPGAVSRPWVSVLDAATTLGPGVQVRAGEGFDPGALKADQAAQLC